MKPPSLLWCLLGLPFLAAGVGGAGWIVYNAARQLADPFTQMVAPGARQFTFKPGRYAVYLEEQSSVNGKIYRTNESIEGLECRVTSSSNENVPMRPPAVNFNYSFNNRSGHSILEFSITRQGDHEVACDYGAGSGPTVVIAVGSQIGEAFGKPLVKALAAGLSGVVLCIAVVVGVIVARERAKRRIARGE